MAASGGDGQAGLFDDAGAGDGYQPLAARLRPATLADYAGQAHLLGEGKPLRQAIESGQLHSMIFWGPPGTGKTTLARIAAASANAHFLQLSAVLSGVREIRDAIARARGHKQAGRDTVLFVDEVHRFNKAQQDAFLPHVEDGTVIFIGATTENPSFELNNALLSRSRVYKLRPLDADDLLGVLARGVAALGGQVEHAGEGAGDSGAAAGTSPDGPAPAQPAAHGQAQPAAHGQAQPAAHGQALRIDADSLAMIAAQADGDARRALNLLELASDLAEAGRITPATLEEVLQASLRRFDKGGDAFYDQISALHKSVRGSAPDATLYWFCRMLDGGCDPLYIARRAVRMASEDIGNADPRALALCLDAWQVQERLGSPEGELAIAQALLYLACAPKSNAVYQAYKAASREVADGASEEVPMHLRNAPTRLMKQMEHGAGYRYAHDEPGAYAAGENYFPENLQDRRYYHPTDRGLEQRIREKLEHLRGLDAAARKG